jgi:hypothetical protein
MLAGDPLRIAPANPRSASGGITIGIGLDTKYATGGHPGSGTGGIADETTWTLQGSVVVNPRICSELGTESELLGGEHGRGS